MIKFKIPGQPVPQARPRVTRYGAYDTDECKSYKAETALRARIAMRGTEPLEGAVAVFIDCQFEPPSSLSKVRRENAIRNEWHTKKPDGDNCAKGVLDGMKGICWKDDSQVAKLIVIKRYAESACVDVAVMKLGNKKQPIFEVQDLLRELSYSEV